MSRETGVNFSFLLKGNIAIDNKMPIKGKTETRGNSPNSDPLAKTTHRKDELGTVALKSI